jgi:hypothetical protein
MVMARAPVCGPGPKGPAVPVLVNSTNVSRFVSSAQTVDMLWITLS